jgi:hypothetical protein
MVMVFYQLLPIIAIILLQYNYLLQGFELDTSLAVR